MTMDVICQWSLITMIFLFALLWIILSPYFDSQMMTRGVHHIQCGGYSLRGSKCACLFGYTFSGNLVHGWIGFQHR